MGRAADGHIEHHPQLIKLTVIRQRVQLVDRLIGQLQLRTLIARCELLPQRLSALDYRKGSELS